MTTLCKVIYHWEYIEDEKTYSGQHHEVYDSWFRLCMALIVRDPHVIRWEITIV